MRLRCLRQFPPSERNHLVIGNNADPRIGEFDFESRVRKNWPSQRNSYYPSGYLEFDNGKTLDLRDLTIDGVRKYLFRFKDVRILLLLDSARRELIKQLPNLGDRDLSALEQLIAELVSGGPNAPITYRPWMEHRIFLYLPALGLSTLKELLLLLETPVDTQPADATGTSRAG